MTDRPNLDDPDGGRPFLFGMQIGEVTHRNDPKKLGRIRCRIPGVLEPSSAWAYPIGAPGGGSRDRGTWWIPEVGGEVAVFFKGGDPDHPYYMTGNWGHPRGQESEVPKAAAGDPDVVVTSFGAYEIVVDTRPATKKLTIRDKKAEDNVIEFDGLTRRMKISSTVGIAIESTGQIEINGLVVMINGIVAGSGQL